MRVATLDLHDETFVAAEPAVLRRLIVDQNLVGRWFPRLRTTVFMDRDDKGVRWSVTGEVDGSLEVWLEQIPRGTVVHWFVRGEPQPVGSARRSRRLADTYTDTLNAGMFSVKDTAEGLTSDA